MFPRPLDFDERLPVIETDGTLVNREHVVAALEEHLGGRAVVGADLYSRLLHQRCSDRIT
jgi:hypothetical protein